MFLFQELDRAKGKFRPPKMAIVRFKKSKGSYRKQSSFNISNEKQARQITEVLEGWYPKIAEMTAETIADEATTRATATATKTRTPTSERRARRIDGRRCDDRRHRQSAVAREPPQSPHRRRVPGDRRRSRAACWRPRASRSWTRWRPTSGSRRPPSIAVHGGDGTLHKTVTALGRAFGDRPAAADRDPVRRDHERRRDLAAHPRATVGVPDGDRRRGPQRPAARDDPAALPAHRRRAGVPVRQRSARQLPRRVLRAERLRSRRARGCCSRARSFRRSGTARSSSGCSSGSRARSASTAPCSSRRRSSA